MIEGPLLWFLNRGSGILLMVLMTVTVALGVLAMGGRPGRAVPRFVTQAVHRNLALLSVVALVTHVVTAVMDEFVDIRWWHAVVPVGAGFEPLWVGLGTLAVDLILLVVVTSLLRTRLTHRGWRGVHYLAWLAWLLGMAHGLAVGTDIESRTPWAIAPTLACIVVVALAAGVRLIHVVTHLTERSPA